MKSLCLNCKTDCKLKEFYKKHQKIMVVECPKYTKPKQRLVKIAKIGSNSKKYGTFYSPNTSNRG